MSPEEALEIGCMTMGIQMNLDKFIESTYRCVNLGKKLGMRAEFIYNAYLSALKRVGVVMYPEYSAYLLSDLSSLNRQCKEIMEYTSNKEIIEKYLSWCKQIIHRKYYENASTEQLIERGVQIIMEAYNIVYDKEREEILVFGRKYRGVYKIGLSLDLCLEFYGRFGTRFVLINGVVLST